MKTLFKSILFAGVFLSSQAFAQMYFDGGLGNADPDFGDSEIYLKLGLGLTLDQTWSGEAGYLDLGDNVDGLFANVKGHYRVNSDTLLFAKAGAYLWDAPGADGSDLLFGGGVTFERMGPGHVNLELMLTDLDGNDVTLIGASYTIPFRR